MIGMFHQDLPVAVIGAGPVGLAAAARQIQLVLPETGVCSAPSEITSTSCCGGPAPAAVDACCVDDAVAKANGEAGCGCTSTTAEPVVTKATCCQGAA